MSQIREILLQAVKENASDIFLVAGRPVSFRKDGQVETIDQERLSPEDTENMIRELYELADHRDLSRVADDGDDDFALSIKDLSRFRISAYKQRGSLSAVILIIRFNLPDYDKLGIPESIIRLADATKGMVLITGPAGSGKSTTLSCMINHINETRTSHIITLEDPIEYLHRHNRSIISQREVTVDTESYITALRSALRQSPDVILLGEMRDYETISVAMTAAETGHLLLSTLHTIGASNTINRIIDVFPANQQRQISVQLSLILNAVVSMQLIPAINGGQVPAFEIMTVTPAIRNMIRDNKVYQIDGVLHSAGNADMIPMDESILKLYKEGIITKENALIYATNPENLERKLK